MAMTQDSWRKQAEWPLAGAAVLFLVLYSVQVLVDLDPAERSVLDVLIWGIWAAFLADYIANLVLARARARWFLRNLHELLILVLPMLRPLRLLRLLTLLRALNRAGGHALRGRIVMYVLSSAAVLTYVASLAVLEAEKGADDANITHIGDSLWWALTTVTSVGYGDHFPVSPLGRMIAGGLMIGGIAVLSVITASLASWLVERVAAEAAEAAEAADGRSGDDGVRQELAEVRAQLERLIERLEGR